MKKASLKEKSFYILLLTLGAGFLFTIRHYLTLFFLAYVVVIVAEPLYLALLKKVKKDYFASILTTLLIILFLIIPLALMFVFALSKVFLIIGVLAKELEKDLIDFAPMLNNFAKTTANFSKDLEKIINENQTEITDFILGLIETVVGFVSQVLIPILSLSINAIMNFVFFSFFMLFLFPVKKNLNKFLVGITPLDKQIHKKFVAQFEEFTKKSVYSTLASMLILGTLSGIILFILNVPQALLWAAFIMIASAIPFAAGITQAGIAIYLIANGSPVSGIILMLWSVLVVGTVDNVIRAKIAKQGDEGIPELLTIISILGGLRVFGYFGILYGPIIAALFYTALKIYYDKKKKILIKK